jgi:hypothetical protein
MALRHAARRQAAQSQVQQPHQRREAAEEQHDRPLQQPDALHPGHRHQPGGEADEGADQRGQEDVGGVEAGQALLERHRLADGDHRGRDQRDARGVEHQEHDHRVAGHVLVRG